MLNTSPNIPATLDDGTRFIVRLKALLRLYAQQINKLEERIEVLEKKK